MKLQIRERCILTDKNCLEHLYTFRNFPVFMGCTAQPLTLDIKADMSWWISKETGVIQLRELLPLEIIYSEAHGSGRIGSLWSDHHTAFAAFLHETSPSNVLEIGGAHGILSQKYLEFEKIPWVIVDPNPTPVPSCPAVFIKKFFDSDFSSTVNFDTVVHSHVLEHIYNPNKFMEHIARLMLEGSRLVFSVPNMRAMIRKRHCSCINFEHTIFLTEPYIELLLAKNGFRVEKRHYFMDDHSIFYAATRDSSVTTTPLPPNLYEEHKALYIDQIYYFENLVQDLNKKIHQYTSPVYLFGAHVVSQYLIAFGLDTSRVEGIIDNDSAKQNKRLYGTRFRVESPVVLRQLNSPIVILQLGAYNSEIKQDILNNINKETVFFE